MWSQFTNVTDGQTTCDRNTALCSKVHRAVKSKPTWKLKHANSILEPFEYFCQISSKFIVIISNYTVSKLGRFWDTVYNGFREIQLGLYLFHNIQLEWLCNIALCWCAVKKLLTHPEKFDGECDAMVAIQYYFEHFVSKSKPHSNVLLSRVHDYSVMHLQSFSIQSNPIWACTTTSALRYAS